MWRFVYRLLLLLAWPWVRLRLTWRARQEGAYGERIEERFGHPPPDIPRGAIWFHTVSAGETIAAAPLIAALAEEFAPLPFLVTTMTPTGSAQVRARLGDRVHHCYAPYDFPRGVERFYRTLEPRLLVLMETELWPNLIAAATRRDVPVMLVNARLSERSARGYARAGGLTRQMLGQLRWIACQYPDHAERFRQLGAPPQRVLVHGSVKFDQVLPADHAERVAALRRRWSLQGKPVWVAGSTHPGEEAAVLEAHAALRRRQPEARLVLVPRHPARAGEVAALVRRAGFRVVLQSAPGAADAQAEVVLGDVMGELLYLYGLGDAAFVGGSLVDVGGHNPIEPALCGKPAAMGPSLFNFPDVAQIFSNAGCLEVVPDARALAERIARWLDEPDLGRCLGERARRTVAEHTGASERLRALLVDEIRAATAAAEPAASAGENPRTKARV